MVPNGKSFLGAIHPTVHNGRGFHLCPFFIAQIEVYRIVQGKHPHHFFFFFQTKRHIAPRIQYRRRKKRIVFGRQHNGIARLHKIVVEVHVGGEDRIRGREHLRKLVADVYRATRKGHRADVEHPEGYDPLTVLQ